MNLDKIRDEMSGLLLTTISSMVQGEDDDIIQFTRNISTDLTMAIYQGVPADQEEILSQISLLSHLHNIRVSKAGLRALTQIVHIALIVGKSFLRGL